MGIITASDGTKLDEGIVLLAKAIRTTESGGDYNAKGGSGESGAYQFLDKNWKSWSKEYLGEVDAPMTPINQDKVAYQEIASLKNQGYNPSQVASIWNSGSPESAGKVGINKFGVRFDVPAYVNKVIDSYKKNQGELLESRKLPEKVKVERPEEIGGFQSLVQDIAEPFVKMGVSIGRVTELAYHGFNAMVANIKDDEEAYARNLQLIDEVLDRGAADIGFLGEVDRPQTYKEIVGTAMEVGAYLLPGAKGVKASSKLLNWGTRGFLFGAGDTLGEGGTVKEAVRDGAIVGAASATLGAALIGISKLGSKGTATLKKYLSSYTKKLKKEGLVKKPIVTMKAGKPVITEGLKIVKGSGYEKWLQEFGKPWYDQLFRSAKDTGMKQLKELGKPLQNVNWTQILTALTFLRKFHGGKLLAGKVVLDFMKTPGGKFFLTERLRRILVTIAKTEGVTLNNRTISISVANALVELLEEIEEELR